MGQKRKQDDEKFVRIGLTLPPELKRQMMALPAMNWSEVAVKAFRERIALEEALRTASKEPQGSTTTNEG